MTGGLVILGRTLRLIGEALWRASDAIGWVADHSRGLEVKVNGAGHALFGAGVEAAEVADHLDEWRRP